MEEVDHFEDWNDMLQITPIFHVKMTTVNYEHLRPPAFTNRTLR